METIFSIVNCILGGCPKTPTVFISERLCILICPYHSLHIGKGRSDLSVALQRRCDFKGSLSLSLYLIESDECVFIRLKKAAVSPPGVSIYNHIFVKYVFDILSTHQRHTCPVFPPREIRLCVLT